MLCYWFNLGEKIDRSVTQEKDDATQEFTLAVLKECLRTLAAEKPTAAAPALPGTR